MEKDTEEEIDHATAELKKGPTVRPGDGLLVPAGGYVMLDNEQVDYSQLYVRVMAQYDSTAFGATTRRMSTAAPNVVNKPRRLTAGH